MTTTPRALLQFADGAPITPCIVAAWEGLRFLGYDCEAFQIERTPEGYAIPKVDGAIVVGGVQAVHAALAQIGIPKPTPIDYPEALRPWFGRKIRRPTTLQEALRLVRAEKNGGAGEPWFIKPVRPKAFTGDVFYDGADFYNATEHLDEDEPVWMSEVVEFVSEWRCFVTDGSLVGVKHYRGDPWTLPSKVEVVRMVRESMALGRAGLSVDVGVTKDGRTLLVECNDGYALGYYGLDSLAYAELLVARWRQITGAAAKKGTP